MTEQQKEQLVDLIEAYGTYQFMLGHERENIPTGYLGKVKEICEELRDDFGIELIDLTFIS